MTTETNLTIFEQKGMHCHFNKILIQQEDSFAIYLLNHVVVVKQFCGQEHVNGLDRSLNLPLKIASMKLKMMIQ